MSGDQETIVGVGAVGGPVAGSERLAALDVARGFALLGILAVNVRMFSEPFGAMAETVAGVETAADRTIGWLTAILCEGKFYPLFSLLFGMGLVLQRERMLAAGAAFAPVYARRLIVLAAMGLIHGFALWWGDILFVYSVAGAVLLAFAWAGWRLLLAGALWLLLAAILLGGGGMALDTIGPAPPEAAASEPVTMDESISPVAELTRGLRAGEVDGPSDPLWMAAETRAYREGGYFQAAGFRAMSFLIVLSSVAFVFGWHILGMFFLGAALMKAQVLSAGRRGWLRALLIGGFALGLPLAAAGALLPARWGDDAAGMFAAGAMEMAAGPLMAVAYFAAAALAADRRALRWITGPLAATGRMALTNYLGQTVIVTFITYHWGLGLFGSLGRVEQMGIVAGVYVAQVLVSVIWMSRFRFGPMEWAWRWATYGRPPGMRRGPPPGPAGL